MLRLELMFLAHDNRARFCLSKTQFVTRMDVIAPP